MVKKIIAVLAGFCLMADAPTPPPAKEVAPTGGQVLFRMADDGVTPELVLDGLITPDMARIFFFAASQIVIDGKKEINLYFTSPGGNVDAGFEISGAIKGFQEAGVKFTCIDVGHASSMAAYIFEGCDKRKITKSSKLLFHQPYWQFYQDESLGPDELKKRVDSLMEDAEHMEAGEAKKLKITREAFHKLISKKDLILTADEALKIGAVDEVIEDLAVCVPDPSKLFPGFVQKCPPDAGPQK